MRTSARRNRMLKALALSGGLALSGAAGVVTPASAQTFLHYTCAGGAQFEAALFPGTRAAFVQVDGKSLQLPKRLSAIGVRYSKGGVTLRIKGRTATLKRGGKTLDCKAN